jgi:MFS family permease
LLGGAVALLALSEARGAAAIGAAAAALGVVGEVYRPAVMAFVADVVPAPQRPRAFAALYWAINLGFTIAPLAAGALASWSYRALFIADAATMAIYGVIVAVRLPATPPLVVDDDAPRVSLTTVLRDRVFLAFVVLTFAVGLVFHQSTMTLSVHLEHAGYAASTYGGIVAVNGALIILVQPWLAAWAAGKDSTRVLAIAAVLAGLGMGLHGADDAVVVQVIAVVVWTTGEILQSPFFGTVVSTLAPPEARGRYQGVFAVAFGTAAMAAPSTGQAAVAVGGVRGPWLLCAILGVAAAVGLLATARGRRARGVR